MGKMKFLFKQPDLDQFQTYQSWIRGLMFQLEGLNRLDSNVVVTSDEIVSVASPVGRNTLTINTAGGTLSSNDTPYLVTTARVSLFRQDFYFWDKVTQFDFSVDENDSTHVAALDTLQLVQNMMGHAKGYLDIRKDISSINLFIKFKVPPQIDQKLQFNDATVGGSLMLKLAIANFFGDKSMLCFETRITNTGGDGAIATHSVFQQHPTGPQIPLLKGVKRSDVVCNFDHLFFDAMCAFEEMVDDCINL